MKVILAVVKQLKQLQRKPGKYPEAPAGFEPDLRDTSAMLYQLSYEALLGVHVGQEWDQFYTHYVKRVYRSYRSYHIDHMYALWIENTS